MVKAVIILTNVEDMGNTGKKTGLYLSELAHVYEVFKNAGFEMIFVTPKGGKTPIEPTSIEASKNDDVCQQFLSDEAAMKQLANTLPAHSVNAKDFQIAYFPGGHGPMFDLPQCEATNRLVSEVHANGGIVGAVCHGSAGLVNTMDLTRPNKRLIEGRTLTCFTNAEENAVQLMDAMPFALETELSKFCTFKCAGNFQCCTVESERIATGQNPASATPLGELIVEMVKR